MTNNVSVIPPRLDLIGAVPQIQPFTIRETPTLTYYIEHLVDWTLNTLIPFVNTSVKTLSDNWDEQTAELIASWEAQSIALIQQVQDIANGVGDSVEQAQAAQAAAEAARDLAEQYASQAEDIQDTAITGIFENASSEFRTAVDAVLSTITAQVDDNANRVSSIEDVLDTGRLSVEAIVIRDTLNILDYGVQINANSSQTAAIKAALDANPGRAFYFPPGDYRFDTGLVVSAENSLILDKDARFYAAAIMDTLVTYLKSGSGYAEDKAIIGGTLDGALKANRLLSIGKIIRMTLTQMTFVDGVNRGLVTEAGPGAELFAYDLRFHNTSVANVVDNVAIESKMGDSHYRDIVMRDWTIGVIDTAANRWDRVHPWVGPDETGNPQMTSRYATSVGFIITGASDMFACLPDTMRTGFRFLSQGAYTPPARLLNCRVTWSSDTLPNALSAANPGYVFDNQSQVGFISDRLTVTGHTGGAISFLLGTSKGITARNTFSYGYIKDATGAVSPDHSYVNGIKQGMKTFTPTVFGSAGAGEHAYVSRTGRMVVQDDVVTYDIAIQATLDGTTAFAGEMRIGGIPVPEGASQIRSNAGVSGLSTQTPIIAYVTYGGAAPWITPLKSDPSGNVGIDIPANGMRGKSINISLQLRTTMIPVA